MFIGAIIYLIGVSKAAGAGLLEAAHDKNGRMR
jgi:hypothetical protein